MNDASNTPAAQPAAERNPLLDRVEAAVAAALGDPALGSLEQRITGAIAGWVGAHVLNSPIAQATGAYNHLLSVLPHLAQAILKEI